jgi:hypothetical protein
VWFRRCNSTGDLDAGLIAIIEYNRNMAKPRKRAPGLDRNQSAKLYQYIHDHIGKGKFDSMAAGLRYVVSNKTPLDPEIRSKLQKYEEDSLRILPTLLKSRVSSDNRANNKTNNVKLKKALISLTRALNELIRAM